MPRITSIAFALWVVLPLGGPAPAQAQVCNDYPIPAGCPGAPGTVDPACKSFPPVAGCPGGPVATVDQDCLNDMKSLVESKALGKELNEHFPTSLQGNLKHKAGGSINKAGTAYTHFLGLIDDVRANRGLRRIAAVPDYDSQLGQHVLEGLCTK